MPDNTETTVPTPESATTGTEDTSKQTTIMPPPGEEAAPTESGIGTSGSPAANGEQALTGDKVLDIAFGVAVLAAEAAGKLAKQFSERLQDLQDQAPTIADNLQEKGRPVREKFVGKLREQTIATTDVTPAGDGEQDSKTSAVPAPANGKPPSAEDEISALERRVRELEQEVAVSPTYGVTTPAVDAAPAPEAPAETTFGLPAFTSEPTPAEEATYVPADPTTSLEESPYAISETEDEAIAEQVEEAVETAADAEGQTTRPRVSRKRGGGGGNTPEGGADSVTAGESEPS